MWICTKYVFNVSAMKTNIGIHLLSFKRAFINFLRSLSHPICRGVSRIFIIGFPTNGVGRYFHRGVEATSDTQLNPGNLNSVCLA